MISVIRINEEKLDQFIVKSTPNFLRGIVNINVLAGTNNSGKSRFLRTIFYDIDNVKFIDPENNPLKYQSIINSINRTLTEVYIRLNRNNIKLKPEFDIRNKLSELKDIKEFSNFIRVLSTLLELTEDSFIVNTNNDVKSFNIQVNEYKGIYANFNRQVSDLDSLTKSQKIYIPILRGLRPIQKMGSSDNDSFTERTKRDYFKSLQPNMKIFSGLGLYDAIMEKLLGLEKDRKDIRDFEIFLKEKIFFDEVTLIPKHKEDVLHIKIGKDPQFPIYDLGDGLQTLIIILFPIFMSRNEETLFFIEEPEAHLHPKWQSLLLNSLKTFSKHTFFISTHSNSFINDNDVSVFTFTKKNKQTFIQKIESNTEKFEAIKSLGYKTSDLLQSNYILWVEGPSDRIYFNYWISKTAPDLIEGIHYTIMYFGGDNFYEYLKEEDKCDLTLIQNINQSFGIVIDSDKSSSTSKIAQKKLDLIEPFKQHKYFTWITNFREIENYIPLEIFIDSVKKVHNKTDIEIDSGNFSDRCSPIDNLEKPSYKAKITLPKEVFSKVQKNKDGSTRKISDVDLREAIEKAIQSTKSSSFKVKKIELAKEVVKQQPEIEETELKSKIDELILAIKKANDLLE